MNDELKNVPTEQVEVRTQNGAVQNSDADHNGHHHSHGTHHRHSSHHSHRGKHHSRYGKHRWRRMYSKLKKNPEKAFAICSLVIVVVFAFGLSVFASYERGYHAGKAGAALEDGTGASDCIQVVLKRFDAPVEIANPAVLDYMNSNPEIPANEIFEQYRGRSRLDLGAGVELSYSLSNTQGGEVVEWATVEIIERGEDAQRLTYEFDSGSDRITIYDLKGGTDYEYTVLVRLADGHVVSAQSQFTTSNVPRILSIDGIFNVRDIGGWKTVDGKVVRQGLLYRGTEFDGAVEKNYKLSTEGVNMMRNTLGINMDMDLRNSNDTGNSRKALGIDIPHIYYNADMYADIFTDSGKEKIKWIFADLAKRENYPIYLHCTYGCDRTGTVCYLLEALLGVSETDAVRDYELSSLFAIQLSRDSIMLVYQGLQAYDGNSLKEKAESYLLSAGVTERQIANIRDILLEKAG